MAVDSAGEPGPYTGAVVEQLRYFPHEIEADFHAHFGLDIVDWWRHAALGEDDPNPRPLTGRKVMALLSQLGDVPGESQYLKARYREGDWPELMYLLAGAANEQKMGRKDQAAYHGRDMSVDLFMSPRQREDQRDARLLQRAAHDHLVSQMSGGANQNRPARYRSIIRDTDIDQKRKAAAMKRKAVNHG